MISPRSLQERSAPLGPGGRPFRRWRVLPLLLSIGAFGANAVILLSDRAPGLLGRISARIDAGVSRAASASWSWFSLLMAGGTVFACSVALELAQGSLTNSRLVQRSDVLGNASGVILGTCAVAAFAVAWRAFNTMRS